MSEDKSQTTLIDTDEIQSDPQKNLIPSSDEELAKIIGAEANYDRWSNFVFPHVKSSDLFERRKREWKVTLSDGEEAFASIEIIPARDERCYTSRSYDVFLAIIMIWKERGMPDEPLNIYISDVAKKLDLKPSGQALNQILEEINCLYFTTISWGFSFETKYVESETLKNQRVLDTFEYQKIVERRRGTSTKKRMCKIRLSEHIRDNLRNQKVIPVNFTARKSIKSDVAKTIYSRVDNILAKNKRYERRAQNIVHEYNLTVGRYTYKSQRKALLELIQKNLDGIETSKEGVFMDVQIAETVDKLDWKAIFTTRGTQQQKKRKHALPVVNKDTDVRDYLIDEIAAVIGGKDENYGLYNSFALYYSENHIFRALGEYKELSALHSSLPNKRAYFTAIVHTVAHKLGLEWIKPEACGKNCRYRPENQLFPE